MIPLFNLWFGANTSGIILFVAYGVAVIMFIGTINAVRNVPKVYLDRAATVGASRTAIFRHVILPAIFPEIRASFLLSFGLSWSLVVAGELLGAQSGLGVIVTYALQFAYTGRVMIVAFLFIIYAGLSLRSLMQCLEELSIGILKSIRGRRVDLPPDRAQCEWRSETSFKHLSRRFCGLKGLESRARGLPGCADPKGKARRLTLRESTPPPHLPWPK